MKVICPGLAVCTCAARPGKRWLCAAHRSCMRSHAHRIVTNSYFKSTLSESLVAGTVLVYSSSPPCQNSLLDPEGQRQGHGSFALRRGGAAPAVWTAERLSPTPPLQGSGERPHPGDWGELLSCLKKGWNKCTSTQKMSV